jgi:hypothetical protein
MLRFLDIFFIVFHTLFILFILVGWSWKKTRRIHLVMEGLTALSWFGLGIWFGFGYCPFTDWHWQVRIALGDEDLPTSYIKFLIDRLTGFDVNAMLVDTVTVAAFLVSIVLSLALNARDYRAGHRKP